METEPLARRTRSHPLKFALKSGFDWIRRALLVLALVDAGLVVSLTFTSRSLDGVVHPVVIGHEVKIPPGHFADGRTWPDANEQCTLLRFAAPDCQFCRAEQPQAEAFRRQVAAFGCDTVTLAPSFAEADPRSDSTLVSFGMGWANPPLRFRYQPTAVLLDHRGRVLWTAVGQMAPGAAAQGLAALARAEGAGR